MRPGINDFFVEEFRASLPAEYRSRFTEENVQQHAALSLKRQGAPAIIGQFLCGQTGGTALCVIAEDRPGLLATITAALVTHGLDVREAEAFTRKTSAGTREAVDIFWVKPSLDSDGRIQPPVISADDLATLDHTLKALLDHHESGVPRSTSDAPRATETVVRFLEDHEGAVAVLEVETDDRSGLLCSLARALFENRVQILRSQVTTDGRRVKDRFQIVEFDGEPIRPSRRLDIQVAVLSAIDPRRS